jgi:hypothetical protein
MGRSDVIQLIPTTSEKDEYGIPRTFEADPREVMCYVDSVTRSEFFDAGRNGLNPEFVFRVFFGDYNDERLLEYKGKRYSVYRTYLGRSDYVELYSERKGGTNGKTD